MTADRSGSRRRNDIHISEAELGAMTAEMEEMHHASLPALRDAVDDWKQLHHELRASGGDVVATRANRRQFLIGSGVVLGGLALAACGGSSKPSSSTTSSNASGGRGDTGRLTGDLAIVALAAGIENLAVVTYQSGIEAATIGNLGAIPPAVVRFAITAQAHHQAHAGAWNAILGDAGKSPVIGVDKTLERAVVDPARAKVKTVGDLAGLSLELENVAAATYLNAIGLISDKAGIATAATIQPVELQHAAILNFVLGRYPVPDAFGKLDGARTPTDVLG